MDTLKQAVAKASKPFLESVGELLGHEFTAEERLELCRELDAFMTLTVSLIKTIPLGDREGHEVVEEALGMTSPALVKAILELTGDSGGDLSGKLEANVRAFFSLASLLIMALERGKKLEEE